MNLTDIKRGDIVQVNNEWRVYWGDAQYTYYIFDRYDEALARSKEILNPVEQKYIKDKNNPVATFIAAFIMLTLCFLAIVCYPGTMLIIIAFIIIIGMSLSIAAM